MAIMGIKRWPQDVETPPGVIVRPQRKGPTCDQNDPLRKRLKQYGITFHVPNWNEDRLVRWAVSKGAALTTAYGAVGISALLPPAMAIPCVRSVYETGTVAGNQTCLGIRNCFAEYIRKLGLFRVPLAGPPPEGWIDPRPPVPVEPTVPVEPKGPELILRCLEARYSYSEARSRALQGSILAKYPGGVTGPVQQMRLLSEQEAAFVRAVTDCEANPEMQPPAIVHHQPPAIVHHQPPARRRGVVTAVVVAAGIVLLLSR